MRSSKNNNEKQIQSDYPMEVEFGSRKLNTQNFSKTVVLPKEALANCGCDMDDDDIMLDVTLVQKDGERYIKLTPVCKVQTEEPKGDVKNVK
jgi:hypothetical protein